MNKELMVKVLNEWQRKYIENPNEFEAEFRTVIAYLKDIDDGVEPSYGKSCVAYMLELAKQINKGG